MLCSDKETATVKDMVGAMKEMPKYKDMMKKARPSRRFGALQPCYPVVPAVRKEHDAGAGVHADLRPEAAPHSRFGPVPLPLICLSV